MFYPPWVYKKAPFLHVLKGMSVVKIIQTVIVFTELLL